MKLNTSERWLINNPARALVQRFYEVPLLRRLGGRVESGRVLEVGCGQGVALPLLLSEFGAAHAHGVDLDLEQVRRARRRLGGLYVGRIDLRVASVEDSSAALTWLLDGSSRLGSTDGLCPARMDRPGCPIHSDASFPENFRRLPRRPVGATGSRSKVFSGAESSTSRLPRWSNSVRSVSCQTRTTVLAGGSDEAVEPRSGRQIKATAFALRRLPG